MSRIDEELMELVNTILSGNFHDREIFFQRTKVAVISYIKERIRCLKTTKIATTSEDNLFIRQSDVFKLLEKMCD